MRSDGRWRALDGAIQVLPHHQEAFCVMKAGSARISERIVNEQFVAP